MGYYTRYSLHAIEPTRLEPVNMDQWPITFKSAVQLKLASYYFQNEPIPVDWTSGDLFDGETKKWYQHGEDLIKFSLEMPQFVWALHGDGEESDDRWVLYGYRGRTYKEAVKPWVPPPPDMSRLPKVIRVAVPQDPPTAEEALRATLENASHKEDCPALDHPIGMDEGQCNCYLSVVREALKSMRGVKNPISGRVSWEKLEAR